MKRYLVACSLTLMVGGTVALVAACSDDDSTTPATTDGGAESGADTGAGDDGSSSSTGSITPSVTFDGAGTCVVTVAALSGPIDNPSLAGVTKKELTFPGTFSLPVIDKLAPGTYIVGGSCDIGGNNPSDPGPEDPQGGTDGIVVKAGENTDAPITLELIPPDMDGGTDGSTDAAGD